mmetsp:Transcript_15787/g.63580  ORF Transcript_15787/g.63580 Transcript_15787/m.63580 type:complete len:104 (-) Transcript_15787:1949-2260(-)
MRIVSTLVSSTIWQPRHNSTLDTLKRRGAPRLLVFGSGEVAGDTDPRLLQATSMYIELVLLMVSLMASCWVTDIKIPTVPSLLRLSAHEDRAGYICQKKDQLK